MSDPIELASEADIAQIDAWNWHPDDSSYCPSTVNDFIHDHVSSQAKLHPDSQAICAWDGKLTYSEVDKLSNLLASHLVQTFEETTKGDRFIPLCFEKSKWNVIAMLGVLKAGGAFCPMDPKHPAKRKQAIIILLGAQFSGVVLTSASLKDQLTAELDEIARPTKVIVVGDTLIDNLRAQHQLSLDAPHSPATSCATNITPETAAIIIFTSGSTGAPKGIVQEHRTYCSAALVGHGKAMGWQRNWRVLQFAAHTFDVSLSDILTTLMHGGCVCIPSELQRMNDLVGFVKESQANILHLTPTVARLLDPVDLSVKGGGPVECVIFGGEPLPLDVLQAWTAFKVSDNINVVASYGPAECGVTCIAGPGMTSTTNPADVGRPAGCSIWIVNPEDHNQLMPIGAEGELIVEGPIVARGYIGNEKLTSQSFITDPDWISLTRSKGPGRRFYKTGDLGRYASDNSGKIVIAGRNDGQIKLRGQRLEIGEVEYQLGLAVHSDDRYGAVAAAAAEPKGTNNKIFAAFIVIRNNTGGSSTADSTGLLHIDSPGRLASFRESMAKVEAFVEKKVPPYMVPSVYIPLREIPHSLSGKTERKLLVDLIKNATQQELAEWAAGSSLAVVAEEKVDIVTPFTPEQKVLAEVWALEVLQIPSTAGGVCLSVNDNFFNLGGDSAKAMLLVSRLRKRDLALTVADIIAHPTLRDQAKLLKPRVDLVALEPFSLLPSILRSAHGHSIDTGPFAEGVLSGLANACEVEVNQILDAYPLTEMQHRFFAGAYFEGEPWVSNFHMRRIVFKFSETRRSAVNCDRFLEAWRFVAKQHSALRSRVVLLDGMSKHENQLVQVIVEGSAGMPTSVVEDISVEDFIDQDMSQDELVSGFGKPLSRVTVGKISGLPKWFVLTISHGIYDGTMLDMLYGEVANFYSSCVVPRKVPEGIQMNHLVKHLLTADRQSAIDFWCQDLAGADFKSFIPVEMPNDHNVQNLVHRKTIKLSGTLPMMLPIRVGTMVQVSAALLLACELHCGDIIFDCHRSGRTGSLPGIGDLFNMAVNSLPVRVRVGTDPQRLVSDILQETQEHMTQRVVLYEHVGWWHLMRHCETVGSQADENGRKIGSMLRTCPLLNILGASSVQQQAHDLLGIQHEKTVAVNRCAHGLMGTILDDSVQLLVCGNEDVLTSIEMEQQLAHFERILHRVWKSCMGGAKDMLTLGEVAQLLD